MSAMARTDDMNIVFITQDDPFYIKVFFENLLNAYGRREEIKGVFVCKTMGKGAMALARQMYGFYGPLDFIRVGARLAGCRVMSAVCSALGIGRFYGLRQVLDYYKIPVIPAAGINGPEFVESVSALKPDLIISVACPKIFKDRLIALPRLGCINIHTAKLPRYRGMMPNFWNMYNNEKTTGITVHRISAGIDEGEIILQREIPVLPDESLDALIRRTKRLGASLMAEAIEMIRTGSVKPIPNDKAQGTYYSFPTREDVRRFRSLGKRLI